MFAGRVTLSCARVSVAKLSTEHNKKLYSHLIFWTGPHKKWYEASKLGKQLGKQEVRAICARHSAGEMGHGTESRCVVEKKPSCV